MKKRTLTGTQVTAVMELTISLLSDFSDRPLHQIEVIKSFNRWFSKFSDVQDVNSELLKNLKEQLDTIEKSITFIREKRITDDIEHD
jgi:hypothetical protein